MSKRGPKNSDSKRGILIAKCYSLLDDWFVGLYAELLNQNKEVISLEAMGFPMN